MILNNVNRNKLHDELIYEGIVPLVVKAIDTTNIGAEIIFEDGTDMSHVQSIIIAHDPTPIPTQPSELEKLRLEMARSNAEMFEMIVKSLGGGF